MLLIDAQRDEELRPMGKITTIDPKKSSYSIPFLSCNNYHAFLLSPNGMNLILSSTGRNPNDEERKYMPEFIGCYKENLGQTF